MIQNDIRKFLIRNSIITYAAAAVAIVAVLLNYLNTRKSVEESRKYLYMIRTDGEIVPLEWVNRRENMEVEYRHHVYLFVKYFYELNQYTWKNRVEKALWLGDFKQLHIRRTNEGYYNRFIQFGIEQEATVRPEDIELYEEDGQVKFRAMISLIEKIDARRQIPYVIFAKGTIRTTSRQFDDLTYAYNPHGLYIDGYVEEKVVKETQK